MTCKCSKCGKFYTMRHTTREDDGRCFTCYFWYKRYLRHIAFPNQSFIVDGTAYMVCEEPKEGERGWGCGFGGSEFRIKPFGSDEVIISHNVWCQGDVPDNFKDLLPDNASFIPKVYSDLPTGYDKAGNEIEDFPF